MRKFLNKNGRVFSELDAFNWEETINNKVQNKLKFYANSKLDDVIYLNKVDMDTNVTMPNVMFVLFTHQAGLDKDGRPLDTLNMISQFSEKYDHVELVKGFWFNN